MVAAGETSSGASQHEFRTSSESGSVGEGSFFEDEASSWDEGRGAGGIDPYQLNQALGWFSLGLGLIEVLAPRGVGQLIGAEDYPATIRLCGMREIASGVGLLSQRAPATAAASRLIGGAMDITLLGAALRSSDARPARLALAATTVLAVAAVDAYATSQHSRAALAEADQSVPVSVSIAINSTPEKLYRFWRNFENLPRFMDYLQSVTSTGERTSHWRTKVLARSHVEWDSEIVTDRPNEMIAWRTLPGSDVRHRGSVSFESAGTGRGCIIHVELVYGAPGGGVGAGIAKIFGADPELQIRRDLRALKQLLETGEVATTRGQPSGKRTLLGRTFTRRES
jgi:uncharacterized membrane protein